MAAADQEEISKLMPEKFLIRSADGSVQINQTLLQYDSDWLSYISQFQEDIREGRNDPEWQEQAMVAYEKRKEGDLDSFKDKEYEEFWGQKQKLASDVVAGSTSKIKLDILVEKGIILKDDVLVYSRKFLKPAFRLEKEVTVSTGLLENPINTKRILDHQD